MSIFEPARAPWPGRALSILRIVASFVFIAYGTAKLFNYPPGHTSPPLFSLLGMAGILEVVGGLAIVLGLYTRPVAFILSGQMAVAYFKSHAQRGFWPSMNGGTPAVLYCFLFLFLCFAGAGDWSLDTLIARRRSK